MKCRKAALLLSVSAITLLFLVAPGSAQRDLGNYTITGEAEVGGLVAGVGNRVLGGVAKFMVKRFFKAFDNYIKDHDMSKFTLANCAQSANVGGAS